AILIVLAALAAGGLARAEPDDIKLGQRIYREGILPSGQPMTGLAQAGVVRSGKEAACAICHRRSGLGTAEGYVVIRPIAGPDLFQTRVATPATPRIAHQLGQPTRPAYDDTSLARAIRAGVDVTGRQMQPTMPRYALDEVQMRALTAYLKTLSADPPPGVTDEDIHLATVIQPGVPEARRRAMLAVIEAFVRDKNAGVRSEESRRRVGAMRMYRAYRKWVLHVWQLDGPPATWAAQLERRYAEQPVFALVAGIGAASWQPIHDFSARFEVPCILPLTDLPAASADNFYTIYFSRGIALEADALARYLGQHPDRIVQAYRPDGAGAAAAAALRASLAGGQGRLLDRPLSGEAGPGFWRELFGTPADAVVLWLDRGDLQALDRFPGGARDTPLYLSATLLGGGQVPAGLESARLIYPWQIPSLREPLLQRSRQWLRSRGLDAADEGLQAVAVNTLFALTVAGDALAHMQDSFIRDYFIERVEHNVTQTLMPSFYPSVSLGPDQRYASKGVYIVRQAGAPGRDAAADWIVP
ncbi:MAG: c-type cytochrome, partial [Thiobacillus sp.]|nr:c-type cytochrome [Thiobacillus sp.]